MTLGLGALIGVPPAVLAVLWNAHGRPPTASEPLPPPPSSALVTPTLDPAAPLLTPTEPAAPTVASARGESPEGTPQAALDQGAANAPTASASPSATAHLPTPAPRPVARPPRDKSAGPRSIASAPAAKAGKDPAGKGDMPPSGL
jgi:hypothetical protein